MATETVKRLIQTLKEVDVARKAVKELLVSVSLSEVEQLRIDLRHECILSTQPALREEYAYTCHALGLLYEQNERQEEAREAYDECANMLEGLGELTPYRKYVLAFTLLRSAGVQSDRQSGDRFERCVALRREIVEDFPTELNRLDLALALEKWADHYAAGINYRKALEKYDECLPLYRGLMAENRCKYSGDLAEVLRKLLYAQFEQGQLAESLNSSAECMELLESLKEAATGYEAYYTDAILQTMVTRAEAYTRMGHLEQALAEYGQAVAQYGQSSLDGIKGTMDTIVENHRNLRIYMDIQKEMASLFT